MPAGRARRATSDDVPIPQFAQPHSETPHMLMRRVIALAVRRMRRIRGPIRRRFSQASRGSLRSHYPRISHYDSTHVAARSWHTTHSNQSVSRSAGITTTCRSCPHARQRTWPTSQPSVTLGSPAAPCATPPIPDTIATAPERPRAQAWQTAPRRTAQLQPVQAAGPSHRARLFIRIAPAPVCALPV